MSVRTLLLGILRVGGASARVYIAHKTNTPGRCVVVFDCKLFVHAECTGRACKGGRHGRHLADLLGVLCLSRRVSGGLRGLGCTQGGSRFRASRSR